MKRISLMAAAAAVACGLGPTLAHAQSSSVTLYGDIDEYQELMLRERSGRPAKEGKNKKKEKKAATVSTTVSAPPPAQSEKVRRGPLKRALEAAEKAIADLTKKRADIELKLGDPATYSGPPTVAADLQKEKTRLERELAHAEHEWLVAQEALEAGPQFWTGSPRSNKQPRTWSRD